MVILLNEILENGKKKKNNKYLSLIKVIKIVYVSDFYISDDDEIFRKKKSNNENKYNLL
jgi:hypothetical protein